MHNITDQLKNHFLSEVTTISNCWQIKLQNGENLGFTDCDKDLLIDNMLYESATGFIPTGSENSLGLSVDNLDIEGVLDSNYISEQDLINGKYDYAEITIFKVNYTDLSQGKLIIRSGYLGEVVLEDGKFRAEIRGLNQKLIKQIGEIFSPNCRAMLGDNRCKIDMSNYSHEGIVDLLIDNKNFASNQITNLNLENNYFALGTIKFLTGANQGRSMEIKSYYNNIITITFPMPYQISIGDNFVISAGCNKLFETCKSKFNNIINFRGEPHIPGSDKLFETASTKSN